VILRTFGWAFGVTAVGLLLSFGYGGADAVAVAAILGVLEVSLSFDNAVVNATVLDRMSPLWQKIFLSVGIVIAVFGMRLLFPLIIVGVTASLSPSDAVYLALNDGQRYGELLREAHPAIAAFGGIFLLLLFLDFVFEEREIAWLGWVERPLARIGKLDQVSVVVGALTLIFAAEFLAPADKVRSVLLSGMIGLVTYLLVNGLGELFEAGGDPVQDGAGEDAAAPAAGSGGTRAMVKATGRAAFFLFLYLEVLDASFSFDGVIGAFAVTSDPVVIAIGLGIGAMYIRSLTVYLVRQGTLKDYVYLDSGAHWAIGALAVLLFVSMKYDVPQIVTGLIGIGFIAGAFLSSVSRNRRLAAEAAGGLRPDLETIAPHEAARP